MNGDSILHLSDLHFGKDHNYYHSGNHLRARLIEVIKPLIQQERIGVIIASGDFTCGGSKTGFNEAREFLEQIIEECNVEKKSLVIVPGNHDIVFGEEENPKIENDIDTRYRKFRKQLLGIPEEEDIQHLRYYKLSNNWIITCSCFNSARIRDDYLKSYGYIGWDKYRPLLSELSKKIGNLKSEEYIKRRILNFSICHHHLKIFMPSQIPSADKPVSVLIDGGTFEKELIENGIHFLLHGHQHIEYHGSSGIFDENGKRLNLNILGVGSAGVKIGRGGYPEQFNWNSFNVYTPGEDGFLHIKVYKYNSEGTNEVDYYKVPYL